jgi:hypothetical protein
MPAVKPNQRSRSLIKSLIVVAAYGSVKQGEDMKLNHKEKNEEVAVETTCL